MTWFALDQAAGEGEGEVVEKGAAASWAQRLLLLHSPGKKTHHPKDAAPVMCILTLVSNGGGALRPTQTG